MLAGEIFWLLVYSVPICYKPCVLGSLQYNKDGKTQTPPWLSLLPESLTQPTRSSLPGFCLPPLFSSLCSNPTGFLSIFMWCSPLLSHTCNSSSDFLRLLLSFLWSQLRYPFLQKVSCDFSDPLGSSVSALTANCVFCSCHNHNEITYHVMLFKVCLPCLTFTSMKTVPVFVTLVTPAHNTVLCYGRKLLDIYCMNR